MTNFNLLRPFDIEKAKSGEQILFANGDPCAFIAEGGSFGQHAVRAHGNLFLVPPANLRMAPLCWVEDKPVYKGDRLWSSYTKEGEKTERIASHVIEANGTFYLQYEGGGDWAMDGSCSFLSWIPPKVKKSGWMNIYKDKAMGRYIHDTKNAADSAATIGRIGCVEIHWEE